MADAQNAVKKIASCLSSFETRMFCKTVRFFQRWGWQEKIAGDDIMSRFTLRCFCGLCALAGMLLQTGPFTQEARYTDRS